MHCDHAWSAAPADRGALLAPTDKEEVRGSSPLRPTPTTPQLTSTNANPHAVGPERSGVTSALTEGLSEGLGTTASHLI